MEIRCLRVISILVIGIILYAGPTHAKYSDLDEELKDVRKFMMRKILPVAQDAVFNTDIKAECSGALFKLLNGARENSAWALKFLTSNGLVPSAALYLGSGDLGHYGQCVSSKGPLDAEEGKPTFRGKFCSLFVTLPADLLEPAWNLTIENGDIHPSVKPPVSLDEEYFQTRLRFSICVPSSCGTQELSELISHIVAKYEFKTEVYGCRTLADEDKRSTIYYIAIWTFIGLLVLAALSTAAEYTQWAKPGDIGCMFSLIMNNRMLFAETAEKNRQLAFLNGTKAVLAFWIVFGHTYIMVDHYTMFTTKEALDMMMTPFGQIPATGGFLSVSTFFSISGFLLSYGLLSYTGPARPPTLMYVIIMVRRYIRLTLPAVAVILFGFVLPAWAHGPTTDNLFELYTKSCNTNWWRALTYTNNFVEMKYMCWYHFWYMSVDMQIMLVAIIFALLMNRRPKLVSAVLTLCAMCSCIWIFSVTYRQDLPVTAIFNENVVNLSRFMSTIYVKSLTHVGSFVIGMLAGLLYFKAAGIRLDKIVQFVSFAICFGVMAILIEATLPIYCHIPIPRWIELLYAGFHRVLWSLACCWLFVLMATNNMKWLSRFLSCHALVVLGRLSFATYLVHVPLITYFVGINTVYVQMSHAKMIRTAIGNHVLSTMLAYILHILVEAPTIQLDCLLFKSSTRKHSETPLKQFNGAKNGDAHVFDVKIDPATKL